MGELGSVDGDCMVMELSYPFFLCVSVGTVEQASHGVVAFPSLGC